MLHRFLPAMGGEPPAGSLRSFADESDIAPWAEDAVGSLNALRIMEGVGGERFDPYGAYTIEQSLVTLVRVYDLLNK